MARIRSIKPEFFRHYELFEAEKETELPLRLAFIGLWTVCDREGRFKWRPEMLKVECLPYDTCDFSRVLDALRTRGFIVKYATNDREYGWIPSFKEHQVINNKESASLLPEPNSNNIIEVFSRDGHATTTRADLDQGEGKGKEGKGKEKEGENNASIDAGLFVNDSVDLSTTIKQPEKEKEKSSAKKEKDLVFPFTSEEFLRTWAIFIELGKQKKKPFESKQQMLMDLSQFDEEFSIHQLKLAIGNNWQGLTFSDTKEKYKQYLNAKKGISHGTKQQINADKFAELDAFAALAGKVVSSIDSQNR